MVLARLFFCPSARFWQAPQNCHRIPHLHDLSPHMLTTLRVPWHRISLVIPARCAARIGKPCPVVAGLCMLCDDLCTSRRFHPPTVLSTTASQVVMQRTTSNIATCGPNSWRPLCLTGNMRLVVLHVILLFMTVFSMLLARAFTAFVHWDFVTHSFTATIATDISLRRQVILLIICRAIIVS